MSSFTLEDLIAYNPKFTDWSNLCPGSFKPRFSIDYCNFLTEVLGIPFEELEEGEVEDNAVNLIWYVADKVLEPINNDERKSYNNFIQSIQIACKNIDSYITLVAFESDGAEEIHTMNDILEYEYERYCDK